MEERSIRFHTLNKDELIYEVAIRDGVPENTVERLRAQIRTLAKQIPTDEVNLFEGDVTSELQTVRTKLSELQELVNKKPLLLKRLYRIQALGNHLFHRLSRVEPTEKEDVTLKADLDDRLLVILRRIDGMFHTFTSTFEFKPPGESDADRSDAVGAGPAVVDRRFVNCDRVANVHSLNLKFNGQSGVLEFLERLEELCVSRGISSERLFLSAVELFVDDALCWYRGIKNEVRSWEQLKTLLIEEYLPSDYDHRLLQEIRSRTQGADESIIHYLSILQNYFSRLRRPLDDREKLDIAKFNIRPCYTLQLALIDIESWSELKRRCRQLEAAKVRSEFFTEPPRNAQNTVAPDLAVKGGGKLKPKCEAVKPAAEKFCVRCRVKDHTLLECKAPRIMICYRCGEKGVITKNCPKCSPKNREEPETKNA